MSCCSDFLIVFWGSFRRIMYPRNKIYKYHISALHSLTLLCILSLLFTTCPITVMTRRICLTIKSYKFVISFFHSHGLYVWFRGNTMGRNEMLITLRLLRVNGLFITYLLTTHHACVAHRAATKSFQPCLSLASFSMVLQL